MFKISLVGIIFFALLVTEGRNCGQGVQDKKGGKGMNLKLIGEYQKNKVKAISSDGKKVLFYQTSTPMRTFSFPLDGNLPRENKAKVNDDMLRVVDFLSKREIASLPTNLFPYHAEFIPGTNTVFYSERENQSGSGVLQKIWSIDTNKVSTCLDTKNIPLKSGEGGLSDAFIAIDQTKALGIIWQRDSGHILVSLSLLDCAFTRIGPVSPDDSSIRTSGFSDYASVSNEHVALTTRERKIIIRKVKTLELVKEILPPTELRMGEQIMYTPDGKYLIAVASNTIVDRSDTKRYLLFFDTKNYDLVRQLDVTKWSPPNIEKDLAHESSYVGTAMAISPDSDLIAVGFTRIQKTLEQAEIVLFDLKTGEEITRAGYPAIKQNRDDPFAARVGKLIFSPDGKYLFSSTHDTLVWELKN